MVNIIGWTIAILAQASVPHPVLVPVYPPDPTGCVGDCRDCGFLGRPVGPGLFDTGRVGPTCGRNIMRI